MALKSMTGFGRGDALSGKLRAEVELSSVNRKQLEVRVNLPKTLSALESRVVKRIGKYLSRGHVAGSVTVSTAASGRSRVSVDGGAASEYVSALRNAAKKLGLKDDLSARLLLNLPEVVQDGYSAVDLETAWPVIARALDRAIARLSAMREKEGNVLRRDLERRLAQLRGQLYSIEKQAPGVIRKYRQALIVRLKKAGMEVNSNDPELLKELALFADRCDISEEITRLGSHLKQASALVSSGKAVGRTLDFLAQEMFREINTIGSKANNADIARHVVTFKTELERIREQVQNVE